MLVMHRKLSFFMPLTYASGLSVHLSIHLSISPSVSLYIWPGIMQLTDHQTEWRNDCILTIFRLRKDLGAVSILRCCLSSKGIHIIKIRRSHVFIMKTPILGKTIFILRGVPDLLPGSTLFLGSGPRSLGVKKKNVLHKKFSMCPGWIILWWLTCVTSVWSLGRGLTFL